MARNHWRKIINRPPRGVAVIAVEASRGAMRTIPLSQSGKHAGKYRALVDDEDYEQLSGRKWQVLLRCSGRGGSIYARSGKQMMHHLIFGKPKVGEVDHINGNGLDNRRSNLRLATRSQNQAACRNNQKRGASGYRGVFISTSRLKKPKWFSAISHNGKQIYLGFFDNPADAANAYDKAARKLFGEFAQTNSG